MFLRWPPDMKAPERSVRLPKLSGGKRRFAEVAATNAPLARYLKSFRPSNLHEIEALEYLRNGAPFKGERFHYHDLYEAVDGDIAAQKEAHKEQIKRAGGRWLQNPEHQGGVMAKGVKFGWWVADDTRVLTKLLDLDPTDWGKSLWKPLDFSDTATAALKAILEGSSP